jgi:nucleotide-binding universal stress UspA family protein
MSFKKILVPLEGLDSDSAAVDVALLLGRQFQAHIEAFYAKTTRGNLSTSRIKREGLGDAEIGLADKMEASRVRELFTSRCNSHKIKELSNVATGRLSANFLELRGIEADLIVEHGRLSDLIVFAHPDSIDPHWPNISILTALQETARPVLLVPSTATRVGKRNVIAWNGSLESARAVACAVPILLRGEGTFVITIGSRDVHPPTEKVVEYLKWHGINAQSMVVPIGGSSENSTLLTASRASEADLIILGAYTRLRTGRSVFGSMTIEMIKQKEIPVFMIH